MNINIDKVKSITKNIVRKQDTKFASYVTNIVIESSDGKTVTINLFSDSNDCLVVKKSSL